MDLEILEDIGLSKREAKAYLALLETGPTTIGAILKKTNIPSSKIYEVLDRLMKKGLVSYTIKKHQKHFQAADPEIVLNIISEKKKRFEAIMPKLRIKQQLAKNKQNVELFEGKQAIFKLFYNLVENSKKGEDYLSFSVGYEHDDPEIVRFYTNLVWKRQEKGLNIKVLTSESIRKIYEKRYSKKVLTAIRNRFTSFNFPQGITIINNKVIMLNWKGYPTAIVIESSNLAEQYKKFFFEIYDKGKK